MSWPLQPQNVGYTNYADQKMGGIDFSTKTESTLPCGAHGFRVRDYTCLAVNDCDSVS